MIRNKRFQLMIGAVGAISLLSGCALSNAATDTKPTAADSGGPVNWSSVAPVKLTVSSIFPPGSTAEDLLHNWMDAATKATGGTVTFKVYEGGVLHPATEALTALKSGLTDVTFVSNGYFPKQLPISNWDDIVVQTATNGWGYPDVNIAGIGQQLVHYEGDSAAAAEMKQNGFMPLLPMTSGPAALTCSKPFSTPADLAGRQVRVANTISQGEEQSLGMVGQFTASNDQYEALQRHVLDCAVNATTTILSGDFAAITPWITVMNTAPTSGANWVLSTTAWDKLAPAQQKALLAARIQPLTQFAKATLDQYAQLGAAAKKGGGGIVDPTPFNQAITAYWAGRPDMKSIAPKGLKDPDASIALTNSVAQAWRNLSLDKLKVPKSSTNIDTDLGLGSSVVSDWNTWQDALANKLGAK
ncbi:TRAP transporter substrate-binding protein DctP [Arthrobacter sp. KNU-44]|uniref:TRAP transporter substrate-binding protein DctP n=1 Tax=Arthrobacter sp. KNU-44 TaxID=3450744 RepID=UPI003F42A3C2